MESRCFLPFLPPYGYSKAIHEMPSPSDTLVLAELDVDNSYNLCCCVRPISLPYPGGPEPYDGGPPPTLFRSRMSKAEWKRLADELSEKLPRAWAVGPPILTYGRTSQCSLCCLPFTLLYALGCCALRNDCIETGKTGRQLNIMYEVLARYNANIFNPRLMHARLYVKEGERVYGYYANDNNPNGAGTVYNEFKYQGYKLVIGIHITTTVEELQGIPVPVVGVDAGYPESIGNCWWYHCPKGGLCCCYPVLDHNLKGPKLPSGSGSAHRAYSASYAPVAVSAPYNISAAPNAQAPYVPQQYTQVSVAPQYHTAAAGASPVAQMVDVRPTPSIEMVQH